MSTGLARYARIYDLVRQIPRGQVATYAQIAFVAELSTPRTVGYAMAALPPRSDVPWQRVINSQGRMSRRRGGGEGDARQAARLRGEGVVLDATGRVDFTRFGWAGPDWEWLEANGYDVGALIWRSQALLRRGPWSRWTL